MSASPRAKPMARPASPRPSPRASPAAPRPPTAEKKAKGKKPKSSPPLAPASLGMPMSKPESLSESEAKETLATLQQKYGALIVNFNNQQAELAAAQNRVRQLEERLAAANAGGNAETDQTSTLLNELRAVEAQNMALQKKVNKLQVEHVSEEEVDQLFYALEMKDHQLAQAQREKEGLEQEMLTARQLTARGTNYEPKFIEIHHHNTLSDDDDSNSDTDEAYSQDAKPSA